MCEAPHMVDYEQLLSIDKNQLIFIYVFIFLVFNVSTSDLQTLISMRLFILFYIEFI